MMGMGLRPQAPPTAQVIGGRPIDGVALLEWARTVIDTVIDPVEQKEKSS